MIEYVVIALSFGLVAFKIYLAERREARWHRRLEDLLNRKMARDFYDYVNGNEVLEKTKHVSLIEQLEKEALKKQEEIRRRNDPPFINQYRPHVEAKV